MVKHFLGWNSRSEFSVQLYIESISYCNNEESCSVCIILKSLLSSANKNKSEYFTTSISVLIINKEGPKTDPHGTPLITSCHDNGIPLTITLCFLLVRKLSIQSTILLGIQ